MDPPSFLGTLRPRLVNLAGAFLLDCRFVHLRGAVVFAGAPRGRYEPMSDLTANEIAGYLALALLLAVLLLLHLR